MVAKEKIRQYNLEIKIKGMVMQIEKALINDRLRVSTVF